MSNKHKHYDLLVAWAGGAKIQVRSEDRPELWIDLVRVPGWHEHREYRVAPKTKVKKWRWVYKGRHHSLTVTHGWFTEEGLRTAYPNIVIVQRVDSTMVEVEE